jgi:hypothetical protein
VHNTFTFIIAIKPLPILAYCHNVPPPEACLFVMMMEAASSYKRIHKQKFNKMQQRIKFLLFHIYMKLNMFQATHRPTSGA